MPSFYLDKSKCNKDGICKRVCPVNAIRLDNDGYPHFREGGETDCLACGQCMAFCPRMACSVEGLPLEQTRRIDRKILPELAQLKELCQSRRSVRQFSKEAVNREKIAELLDIARYAPSAKNNQYIRWICVEDREKMKLLGDMMADAMESDNTSQQGGKGLAASWRKGFDPFFRGAPNLLAAIMPPKWSWEMTDAAIALTYFELAAHASGIGCTWGGYFTRVARESQPIQKILGLAENEIIAGAQFFGYPAIKQSNIPPRKQADITWFTGE